MSISFFEEGLFAGFPSPADDFLQRPLDLHDLIVEHPAATFFIRVKGDSMEGAGIFSGDILVVDRSISPKHHHIVVALLDGGFTVKRLILQQGSIRLESAHPAYPSFLISEETDFQVWGVVTYVIHRAR